MPQCTPKCAFEYFTTSVVKGFHRNSLNLQSTSTLSRGGALYQKYRGMWFSKTLSRLLKSIQQLLFETQCPPPKHVPLIFFQCASIDHVFQASAFLTDTIICFLLDKQKAIYNPVILQVFHPRFVPTLLTSWPCFRQQENLYLIQNIP